MSLRFKNRHRLKPKGTNPSGNAQQRRKAKRKNQHSFDKAVAAGGN